MQRARSRTSGNPTLDAAVNRKSEMYEQYCRAVQFSLPDAYCYGRWASCFDVYEVEIRPRQCDLLTTLELAVLAQDKMAKFLKHCVREHSFEYEETEVEVVDVPDRRMNLKLRARVKIDARAPRPSARSVSGKELQLSLFNLHPSPVK